MRILLNFFARLWTRILLMNIDQRQFVILSCERKIQKDQLFKPISTRLPPGKKFRIAWSIDIVGTLSKGFALSHSCWNFDSGAFSGWVVIDLSCLIKLWFFKIVLISIERNIFASDFLFLVWTSRLVSPFLRFGCRIETGCGKEKVKCFGERKREIENRVIDGNNCEAT